MSDPKACNQEQQEYGEELLKDSQSVEDNLETISPCFIKEEIRSRYCQCPAHTREEVTVYQVNE